MGRAQGKHAVVSTDSFSSVLGGRRGDTLIGQEKQLGRLLKNPGELDTVSGELIQDAITVVSKEIGSFLDAAGVELTDEERTNAFEPSDIDSAQKELAAVLTEKLGPLVDDQWSNPLAVHASQLTEMSEEALRDRFAQESSRALLEDLEKGEVDFDLPDEFFNITDELFVLVGESRASDIIEDAAYGPQSMRLMLDRHLDGTLASLAKERTEIDRKENPDAPETNSIQMGYVIVGLAVLRAKLAQAQQAFQ